MDSDLRNAYRKALTTLAPCDILKYVTLEERLKNGFQSADYISFNVISGILDKKRFPDTNKEVIQLFHWLRAFRQDMSTVLPGLTDSKHHEEGSILYTDEYFLKLYLRYLGILYQVGDSAGEITFLANGWDFLISPRSLRNCYEYNLAMRVPSYVVDTRGDTDEIIEYAHELALEINADEYYPPAGSGVPPCPLYFQGLTLENIIRFLKSPPTADNLARHPLALDEGQWAGQLRDYGIHLDISREIRDPAFLQARSRAYPLVFGSSQYVAQIVTSPSFVFDSKLVVYKGHTRNVYAEGRSPYDIWSSLVFRESMEEYLDKFEQLGTRKAHLSRQVEDEYIMSLHWVPFDRRSRYLMKIENNYGTCERGYRITLYSDNKHRQSEWAVMQRPIGVFRSPEETIVFIKNRDAITRATKKHPLGIRQLLALAQEIGSQHNIVPTLHSKDENNDFNYVEFAGYMLRPTKRRFRIKGKPGIKIVPTYVVETGHTFGGNRESPPEYEVVKIGFADDPSDAIQLILDTAEAQRRADEAEGEMYQNEDLEY